MIYVEGFVQPGSSPPIGYRLRKCKIYRNLISY